MIRAIFPEALEPRCFYTSESQMNIYGNNYNNYQYGTNYSDNIFGYGGNDTQYGYGGNDYLSGGDGNDYQNGGYDNDSLYGSYGNDTQYGSYGNDYLSGGSGYDYLNGGYGTDTLVGGTNADSLVGGYDTSTDYFRFAQGDSNSYTGGADTIYDWNVSYDYIDSSIAGSSSNYAEAWTGANSISSARSHVEGSSTLRQEDHVFLYNSSTDTGYLLSDLDRNYSFETGVVINGAGSQYDMNYSDII